MAPHDIDDPIEAHRKLIAEAVGVLSFAEQSTLEHARLAIGHRAHDLGVPAIVIAGFVTWCGVLPDALPA